MKPTKNIILTLTVMATSAWVANRCVNFAGAQATAGDAVLGVSIYETDAGETAGVDTIGVAIIEAGAAIASGQEVMAAAQGVIVPLTGTAKPVGTAMGSATQAGELVRVLLKH